MNRVFAPALLFICSAAGRAANNSEFFYSNLADSTQSANDSLGNFSPPMPLSEFRMNVETRLEDRWRRCANNSFGCCDVKCAAPAPEACNEDNTICNASACDKSHNPDGTKLFVHEDLMTCVECNCNPGNDSINVRWKGNKLSQCEMLEETGIRMDQVMDDHIQNMSIIERAWRALVKARDGLEESTVTAVQLILRRNDINEKVSKCVMDLEEENRTETDINLEMDQLAEEIERLTTELNSIRTTANFTGGMRPWKKIIELKKKGIRDLYLQRNASVNKLDEANASTPDRLNKCGRAAIALQGFDYSLPYFLANQVKSRNRSLHLEELFSTMHEDYMLGVVELGGWIGRFNELSELFKPLGCKFHFPAPHGKKSENVRATEARLGSLQL